MKLKEQLRQQAKETREHRESLEQLKKPVIVGDNESVLL